LAGEQNAAVQVDEGIAVRDLMTDDGADAAVIHRHVHLRIEEGRSRESLRRFVTVGYMRRASSARVATMAGHLI